MMHENNPTIVRLHSLGSSYFFNNFRKEHVTLKIFLYYRESRQIPKTIKQKAL